jgi:hypothetical protein
MTKARDIIKQALRESNLIAIDGTPLASQNTEGLGKLNTILAGVFGFEAGVQLKEWPVGAVGVTEVTSWTSADWSTPPPNVRLMVTDAVAQTIVLPAHPCNGARMGLNDLTGDMSSNPVTLNPNGRRIEGVTSVTVAIDDAALEWFYRQDLGSWERITLLGLDDGLPFPIQFDAYFETMLAARLNPRYGRALDPQTQMFLNDSLARMRATYSQRREVRVPEEVLRMSNMSGSYDYCAGDASEIWLSR